MVSTSQGHRLRPASLQSRQGADCSPRGGGGPASTPEFLLQSKLSGAFYCATEPEVQSTLHSKNANELRKGSREANTLAQNTFLKGLSLVQKMSHFQSRLGKLRLGSWETQVSLGGKGKAACFSSCGILRFSIDWSVLVLMGKGPLEGEWRLSSHRWSDRRNLSQASAEAALAMHWVLRGLAVRD